LTRRAGLVPAWPYEFSYDNLYVMARKQVIVQLDDELVAALDEEAERAGLSRSELLRRGAEALLEALDGARKERAFVDAYRRAPQDPALVESARRLAARTAPDW
jgi:hypothetical protein